MSQSLTSCQDCYYGLCETLSNNTFSCHCIDGVKGLQCEECLYPGEKACLMNPCWNGGACQNYKNDWSCNCAVGFGGKDCRTAVPVTSVPATTTARVVVSPEQYVRVLNKGGYTAVMTLEYLMPDHGMVTQRGSITSGQSYGFCK